MKNALSESHSVSIAARVSNARDARQQQEESKGDGSPMEDSLSPSPKEILQNAISFSGSDAVLPYPDHAIEEAGRVQGALKKPYNEILMQLRKEMKLLGVGEDDEEDNINAGKDAGKDFEATKFLLSDIPGYIKHEAMLSPWALYQAMERRAAAETLSRFRLDDKQHQALMTAATSQVLVLTGAAGCGKTYATYAIVTYFKSLGSDIHLMAPTGRAASNIRTMANEDASTIHSALKATPLDSDENVFVFKDWSKEEALDGAVIVDETSMVDSELMSHVIKALGENARIIFVGDPNQLPPVSIGAPFQDLIAWNKLPSVYLDQVHRQRAHSSILDAAHHVLRGRKLGADSGMKFVSLPDIVAGVLEPASTDGSKFSRVLAESDKGSSNDKQRQVAAGLAGMLGSDAAVVQLPSGCKEKKALACLVDLVANLKACGADPQVISPATNNKFGLRVDAVNRSLEPVMNDNMYEMSQDWRREKLGFYEGDRVVQVEDFPLSSSFCMSLWVETCAHPCFTQPSRAQAAYCSFYPLLTHLQPRCLCPRKQAKTPH
ncbi:AAA domain-containing protein [Dunaliella salina]|uniref:AAA domain-containing protein n=1 Tax=Dunaliella salina TaxID=3046 RepID=A0ABQ7GGW3_DUNSA|nr:AAA domain-containing protein [Dunaliella salina]|eukprot:KAF5833836.1 AAA domain-containing protein [Dunaliella salina]